MSCSLSAVTDLNNSLSQLSLSPRHGGANQLPRHDAQRGGGVRERECQRGRDGARGTQEEEGRVEREGGRGGRPALEEELIWLEDKTLFLFFSCFVVHVAFVFHISAPNANKHSAPLPLCPIQIWSLSLSVFTSHLPQFPCRKYEPLPLPSLSPRL